MRIGIIGAGFTGLTAAYELSKRGHQAEVFEAAETAGGLSSAFINSRWEWPLDRFYRHLFASDDTAIALAREVGVPPFFPRPITAIWYQGAAYPFDSALAVLRFPGLSLPDKLRTGLVTLYLRLTRNWQAMEKTPAHQWLPRYMGRRAYQTLWEPLLRGKMGEHYREVNMAWFWARIHKRTPRLGYFQGGFQAFVDALVKHIRQRGGRVHLGTPVERVMVKDGRAVGLQVHGRADTVPCDTVIATVSPQALLDLVPELPDPYRGQVKALRSMGALTLVLALKHRLTDGFYWINLPKGDGPDQFPFLALVEHTNYQDPAHYGGDHIVYLGDYVPPEHPYFQMSKEELLALFLPHLPRFNPAFTPDWVRESWLFREPYAQPVPGLNHSQHIPPLQTPIAGLYWASMSQVYPWDRGTNYAVEMGQQVAWEVELEEGGRDREGS